MFILSRIASFATLVLFSLMLVFTVFGEANSAQFVGELAVIIGLMAMYFSNRAQCDDIGATY